MDKPIKLTGCIVLDDISDSPLPYIPYTSPPPQAEYREGMPVHYFKMIEQLMKRGHTYGTTSTKF